MASDRSARRKKHPIACSVPPQLLTLHREKTNNRQQAILRRYHFSSRSASSPRAERCEERALSAGISPSRHYLTADGRESGLARALGGLRRPPGAERAGSERRDGTTTSSSSSRLQQQTPAAASRQPTDHNRKSVGNVSLWHAAAATGRTGERENSPGLHRRARPVGSAARWDGDLRECAGVRW